MSLHYYIREKSWLCLLNSKNKFTELPESNHFVFCNKIYITNTSKIITNILLHTAMWQCHSFHFCKIGWITHQNRIVKIFLFWVFIRLNAGAIDLLCSQKKEASGQLKWEWAHWMVNFWQALSCRCKKLALTYSENCDMNREIKRRRHLALVLSLITKTRNTTSRFLTQKYLYKSTAFRTVFL